MSRGARVETGQSGLPPSRALGVEYCRRLDQMKLSWKICILQIPLSLEPCTVISVDCIAKIKKQKLCNVL